MTPHHKSNGNIPEEIWSEKKVELSHLKIFGFPAYTHVEATERSMLHPKFEKMTFIRYP